MTLAATLALGAWLAGSAPTTPRLGPVQDTTPLSFRGIHAGVPLEELTAALRRRDGHLRCRQARSDAAVHDCHGTLPDSVAGVLAVWVSTMNGVAGVITLSAPVSAPALRAWQDDLTRRYGRVQAVPQGTQRMMQWVRRGRMLRLTWRTERSGTTASVSLVDGRVLDGWGGKRASGADTSH
jgi:hypothetical protein